MCTARLAILFLTALPAFLWGQQPVIGTADSLYSNILQEQRYFRVVLPSDYPYHPSKYYPLIILLDGAFLSPVAPSIIEYMGRTAQIPSAITVAISNTNRVRDFTPSTTSRGYDGTLDKGLQESGGGAAFRRFLQEELLPALDTHYRINNYHTLIGWSLGGLLAGWDFLDEQSPFESALLIDPSIWWDDQWLIEQLSDIDPVGLRYKRLYLSAARSFEHDKNLARMRHSQELFFAELKNKGFPEPQVQLDYLEDAGHNTCLIPSLYQGLQFLFRDYALPGAQFRSAKAVIAHFNAFDARMGDRFTPPIGMINWLAGKKLEKNNFAEAKLLYAYALRNYPQSTATREGLDYVEQCQAGVAGPRIVTGDIRRFWTAYDLIRSTSDSAAQRDYLQQLFLDPASPGQRAFMEAKNYTAADYLQAINAYPKFWASVRANTLRAEEFAAEIAPQIENLRSIYPELQPAAIYFTIGALRSGGTTQDSLIAIGAEFALADSTVVTDEFEPDRADFLRIYFDDNPIHNIVFLNIHEYVHTQQPNYGYNLLSQCLYEGIAEFVAMQATGMRSSLPYMTYGSANAETLKKDFARQMFIPDWSGWLYNSLDNPYGVKDLGYFMGYDICKSYYKQALDKKAAIRAMVELDCSDPKTVQAFVDQSGYYARSMAAWRKDFEARRPEVVNIGPLVNGASEVDPAIQEITIEFSEPMDIRFTNFDLGPQGRPALLRVEEILGFSEDGQSVRIRVELKPGQDYQLLVNFGFRSVDGLPLKPFLLEFTTASQ